MITAQPLIEHMPLFKFFLQKADAQICVSQAIRSFYRNALTAEKSYVVYNGVATKEQIEKIYEAEGRSNDTKGYFVFAIIGLIHKNKAQDTAIRALALLKDSFPMARLIIAGGDDRQGLDIKKRQKLAHPSGNGSGNISRVCSNLIKPIAEHTLLCCVRN